MNAHYTRDGVIAISIKFGNDDCLDVIKQAEFLANFIMLVYDELPNVVRNGGDYMDVIHQLMDDYDELVVSLRNKRDELNAEVGHLEAQLAARSDLTPAEVQEMDNAAKKLRQDYAMQCQVVGLRRVIGERDAAAKHVRSREEARDYFVRESTHSRLSAIQSCTTDE